MHWAHGLQQEHRPGQRGGAVGLAVTLAPRKAQTEVPLGGAERFNSTEMELPTTRSSSHACLRKCFFLGHRKEPTPTRGALATHKAKALPGGCSWNHRQNGSLDPHVLWGEK